MWVLEDLRTWRDPEGDDKEPPMAETDNLYLQVLILSLSSNCTLCAFFPRRPEMLVDQTTGHWVLGCHHVSHHPTTAQEVLLAIWDATSSPGPQTYRWL